MTSMEFIADFHLHSKYSRATSRDMDIANIDKWARLKGIALMGTGDFTHHLWLEELKSKLQDTGDGLYSHGKTRFILTAEISSIYSKNGKGYRIHNIVVAPSFKAVDKINSTLARYGNLASDGRPILGMDAEDVAKIVFDVDENCMVIPAHCWTPWFSLFGSQSGFDRIEDCFGKQTSKIFALETGLSSDPGMNWRLSALDRFSLVSNSDSHSPQKIGREANVFSCPLTYKDIRSTLMAKDKKRFLYTIEFFPEEGKYHYDGHRNCGIRFSPDESKASKNICPKCKRPLTIGVMNRLDQLADRPHGAKPDNVIPYKNLIPLDEVIAEVKGVGKNSLQVEREYLSTVGKFGNEFEVTMRAPEADLRQNLSPRLADALMRVRQGKVDINPGYDGEYGIISIFGDEETVKEEEQLSLF